MIRSTYYLYEIILNTNILIAHASLLGAGGAVAKPSCVPSITSASRCGAGLGHAYSAGGVFRFSMNPS